MPTIRDASEQDFPRILQILDEAIANTTANWDLEPRSAADRKAWFDERRRRGLPILIAEREGTVIGFASFDIFRPFQGFRHTVEHSIYVDPHAQRQGAGRALLAELIAQAKARDMHVMVAGIEAGNAASLALHRQAGFEIVGRLPEVGRKFDRWLDLVFMQKCLG